MSPAGGKAGELTFQNEILRDLQSSGWLLGLPDGYDRVRALYTENTLAFVQATQPEQYQKLYPNNAEDALLKRLVNQLDKADPYADSKELRTYGTLGVLRHGIRDRGCRCSLCQFKPEHDLNPDVLARYQQNRLCVESKMDTHHADDSKRSLLTGLPISGRNGTGRYRITATRERYEH